MNSFDVSMLLSGQYHDWLVSGFVLSIKLAVITLVIALPLALPLGPTPAWSRPSVVAS